MDRRRRAEVKLNMQGLTAGYRHSFLVLHLILDPAEVRRNDGRNSTTVQAYPFFNHVAARKDSG